VFGYPVNPVLVGGALVGAIPVGGTPAVAP